MATLPSHPQLQSQDRPHLTPHQQQASGSQSNHLQSPHPLLFHTGASPDFGETSPVSQDHTRQTSLSRSENAAGGIKTEQEGKPEWGLTKAGKKRQRLPLACQVCRKKKIRCSGEQPICKHCLRFSLPCVYKTTTSRRPRNSLRKDSTTSTATGRRESLSKSIDDESASPSPPPAPGSLAHGRPQSIQPIPQSSPSMTSPNLFFDPFDRQDPSGTSKMLPSIVPVRPSLPPRSVTGPAGTGLPIPSDIFASPQHRNSVSKPQDLSQTQPRLPSLREQAPPENPPSPPALNIPSPTPSVRSLKMEVHTPLPHRSVLLKLVEIYFTHVNNQTYGFLHRPTFLRHIEEGKVPDGLLYSICAISARFSPQHAPPPVSRQSPSKEIPAYHAGEPYAAEARKLALRDFDKPTVQNVQTLLLLALHDFGGKKGQKAWMFAGMAIRMASALRLNREVDGDAIGVENAASNAETQMTYGVANARGSREKVSWTEREVRRRTFWACFVMDRLNSTGMERPHVIQESDCFVQLPTAERSFMFGIPIKTERLIPPPPSDDPTSLHPHTHSMGSEAYLVRIVALWGRVTKYVNQGGRLYDVSPPWTPTSGFAKLSSELQAWLDGLPYWLKYSSSNLADQVAISQAPSFVFMHVAYHTIVCTLHRFSVPSASTSSEPQIEEPQLPVWNPPPEFLQASVKTCFEHARAISTIMAEVISRSDCIVTAPFIGFAMFTANLFHLHQAFTPCPYVDETPEDAREYFATGVTVLNELRIWWGPLEMLYKAIRVLWQAKARNAQIQIMNEQAAEKPVTPAAPTFEGSWLTGTTPMAGGATPRPFWMSSQPNSPGRTEHFDTTGLIPLPGGNFGLDFIDPNLYSTMSGEGFGDMIFDASQLESTDPQYMWWGDLSPAPFGTTFDPSLPSNLIDSSKSPAPPPVTPGRPLSPFSNALHGFGRSLGVQARNVSELSPIQSKKEVGQEHKSILEQIHKDENSVMPPPNLTPRGVAGSTPGTAPGMSSASPASGTGSVQAGTPGWGPTTGSHLRSVSAKSPTEDDRGEDGSEEEEAADLLVYFHARSGGGDSAVVDDSTEVPGDEPRPNRAMSGSSAASSPAGAALRKRKRQEDEDFVQLTSNPNIQSGSQVGIGSGNIFPGKSDGTGTAKEVGKGLYLDQAPPKGSVDLLNLLRQPPA